MQILPVQAGVEGRDGALYGWGLKRAPIGPFRIRSTSDFDLSKLDIRPADIVIMDDVTEKFPPGYKSVAKVFYTAAASDAKMSVDVDSGCSLVDCPICKSLESVMTDSGIMSKLDKDVEEKRRRDLVLLVNNKVPLG